MFEKYLSGVANPANLASFFGSVTWELANRAARSEIPYRHQELVNKWDSTYGSAAVSSYLDNTALVDRKVAESLKRLAPNASLYKPVHTWCGQFNSSAGCRNTPKDGGCTDQNGKDWKHGFNVRVDGRPCNKSNHNRASHVV